MSRVNIGEAYNRLNYKTHESNTPVVNKMKDELIRLRTSTRVALKQSFDERETMRKQCDINTKIISEHEHVIDQMKKIENMWQERALAAEAKLLERPESRVSTRGSFLQKELSRALIVELPRLSQRRLIFPQGSNGEAKSREISEQTVPFPRQSRRLSISETMCSWIGRNDNKNDIPIENNKHDEIPIENDDSEIPMDFILKLHSRDEAISSLEATLNENLTSYQGLQTDMQSLLTERIKEKKIHDSHLQKEEDFKRQLEFLRKELSHSVSKNNDAANEREKETQRMEEKKIHDSYLKKEEDFKGQLESLRKELSQAVSNNNVAAIEREKKIDDSHLQKEEKFNGQLESLRKELSQVVSSNNVDENYVDSNIRNSVNEI